MNRRGYAMLAALWFVVGIAVVTLQFSLEAGERINLGMTAAERGEGRATTLGALAIMQAQLEKDLLNTQLAGVNPSFRQFDMMLAADTNYGGPIDVGDSTVEVEAHIYDLGAQLNINNANENQLRGFFAWILGDATQAQYLAQAILDWRDIDENVRATGAETDDYLQAGMLGLPSNTRFREVADLLHVMGMTPEILTYITPYLTTYGTGVININSAPEAVLYGIPGITADVVANILNIRGQGLRVTNLNLVATAAQIGLMNPAPVVQSTQFLVTMQTWPGRKTTPVKLRALMTRAGTTTTIGWKQW